MNPKLKTALWAAGGAAANASAHYIKGLAAGAPIKWGTLLTAAVAGALTALAGLFTTPPGTTSIPNK